MVSIITALYNNLDLTKAYWDTLLKFQPTEDWEIIWIDDCSTDGTRGWLTSIQSDKCQVILNTENKGYAANNNAGAQMARGDTLCFLNNDIELTEDWYKPMKEALVQNSEIGIVGNIQIHPTSKKLDHAGMGFDLVGNTIHPEKGLSPSEIRGQGSYRKAITAACWLCKKSVFIEAGGFDTSYRNGYEDVDLCLTLGNAGFKHWVAYESRIWHHVSASRKLPGQVDPNRVHFLQKWGELTTSYGQQEWPSYYLAHLSRNPQQVNIVKLVDALLRISKLRKGDSAWARKARDRILSQRD